MLCDTVASLCLDQAMQFGRDKKQTIASAQIMDLGYRTRWNTKSREEAAERRAAPPTASVLC